MTLKDQYAIFPIGLGAMPLSVLGRPSTKASMELINLFLELGGNFIDTADVYGLNDTDRGHNEKLISDTLKKYGKLDDVFIATKGGGTRPNGDGWGLRGGHPKKLRRACEQSLINLNISEHSLYYLHGPDPDIPLEDSLGELIELKNEGKIKNLGIANVTIEELKMAVSLTTLTAVQNRCNPFCKGDLKSGLVEFCKLNKIIYVPYCPLGGWTDHTKLASSNLYNDLALKYRTSSYVISLAWLMSKGDHIIPIPGMDKKDYIITNFESVNLMLLNDDHDKIDMFPDLYSPKHLEI